MKNLLQPLTQWFEPYKQKNITPKIFFEIFRERKLYMQIFRNFRILEGSWIKAFKKYYNIYGGNSSFYKDEFE